MSGPVAILARCPTRPSCTAPSDGIATITLNRPDRLNTIVPPMPDEIEAAVTEAVRTTP